MPSTEKHGHSELSDKSVVFAITVTWIALFNGYDMRLLRVSRATALPWFTHRWPLPGLDFVLTALMFQELSLYKRKMKFG